MRFCRVDRTTTGFLIDPTGYLAALPELLALLPPGAAAFAADPRHSDFSSKFCVKDLKIEQIRIQDGNAQLTMSIDFAFNDINGVPRLSITYTEVTGFDLRTDPDHHAHPDWIGPHVKRLGDVQIDEIVPTPNGCTHEITLITGTLLITCGDLAVTWEAGSEFLDPPAK